jgi:citrate lyase synthetase
MLESEYSLYTREFRDNDLKKVQELIYKTIDISYAGVYSKEAIKFFKKYHSEENIKQDAYKGYTIVLEEINQEKIIGTGTLLGTNVRRVFIDPLYQFKGYGKQIMKYLEESANQNDEINVIDLDSSLVSKKFYDSLGYKTIREDFIMVENSKKLEYYRMEKKIKQSKKYWIFESMGCFQWY